MWWRWAHESELAKVRQLCAGLQAGEIVLFDKGYHQLAHFWELNERRVYFVTRPKEDLLLQIVRRRPPCPDPRVLADDEVVTTLAAVTRTTPGDCGGSPHASWSTGRNA